ncbi:MAG: Na(+)/H(+) antiporter subunit D [Desulfuromonadaceae bacterium]|nr:Na(+)/H(+) antiporter subunit D [Desulfuromonadaceae bacterium]
MIASVVFPPALIFVLGALLTVLLRGRAMKTVALLVPVVGFALLWSTADGSYGHIPFMGLDLVLTRIDPLARIFGYIFQLITLLGLVFSLHHNQRSHYGVALLYAAAAQGVTFAGDLFSLFLFWEVLTVAATFLIAAAATERARGAALRYLLVHIAGGLCLLTGILLHYAASGSIAFNAIDWATPGTIFIFLGFGLNCAWPLLHTWLVDAYPEAPIAGTVFLSAFTTKSAVYVLARGFAGTEALIWVGVAMATFPIFYALLEDNLRRVLSYSLISQVGYMVVGIGIGTQMAINGAVCHAYAHILYKSLLFMTIGAVMYRTGSCKASELGGLRRSMPLTACFCLVGSAAISAVPLFSGFVTKSMIMDAVAHEHLQLVWLVLLAASAGTFLYAGIKIPYFAFFGRDSGLRPAEAPPHMLLAMAGAAFMCVLLGVYPDFLAGLMPYSLPLHPYTAAHVLTKSQLLCFAGLAFVLLRWLRLWPAVGAAVYLDVDWFYRRVARLFYGLADRLLNGINAGAEELLLHRALPCLVRFFEAPGGYLQIAGLRLLARFGLIGRELPDTEGMVECRSRSGTYPVGIGVLLAVLYLAVMSLLFFT